jgi:ADP-Ribosyltransferase in polyvalent proteins
MAEMFGSMAPRRSDPDWQRIMEVLAAVPAAAPLPIFGSMAAGLHEPPTNGLARRSQLQRRHQLRDPTREEALTAHQPTWRETFAGSMASAANAISGKDWNEAYRDSMTLLGVAPVTGTAMATEDAYSAYQRGDYFDAALNAAAAGIDLIPGVGKVGAAAILSPMGTGANKALLKAAEGTAAEVLPIDTASRMERAKQGGFHTGLRLYHGSDADFREFDPSRAGSTTGAAPAHMGVWTAADPETASEFAYLAAKAHGGNPQVYPLLHRAKKPAVVDLDGSEMSHEIAATLDDAFSNGYDAVMFRNYATTGGKSKIVVVKDPAQLRSVFAQFDLRKLNSRDLLASLIAVGAAAVISGEQDTEIEARGGSGGRT